ncbi:MAG TPA: preprotein translocase subunit SecE [Candidatus Eisenbacteria bacterium]|nr:preprotein translocase subunit SecE [Candidatus Eisenbacteria bacterium]
MSLVGRMREFWKNVGVEITKVSWPTRDELRASTIVVIVTVLIVAAYIGVVDRVLNIGLGLVFK